MKLLKYIVTLAALLICAPSLPAITFKNTSGHYANITCYQIFKRKALNTDQWGKGWISEDYFVEKTGYVSIPPHASISVPDEYHILELPDSGYGARVDDPGHFYAITGMSHVTIYGSTADSCNGRYLLGRWRYNKKLLKKLFHQAVLRSNKLKACILSQHQRLYC